MVNLTSYGGYWELVTSGNIFLFLYENDYSNNFYAKFGVDTFPVKRLHRTGNINSGQFDGYLSISNILNVTDNLIITSVGNLPISNNVSVTKNLISDKSKKRRRGR